jgi:hypothetical protein
VHLHFDDQNDDEFLAEVAEKDPEAIWSQWISLDFGGDREKRQAFSAALKRAREVQKAKQKIASPG